VIYGLVNLFLRPIKKLCGLELPRLTRIFGGAQIFELFLNVHPLLLLGSML